MKFLKIFLPIIILILLSVWAIKPFTVPGFFPIHDDTQIARVFEITKSLKDGMFPVRWVSDLGYGYGYPIFNFYAPLSYYIGAVFQLGGLDALWATKTMMMTGVLFSGIFMYFLGKQFWGKLGGIVSAFFYLYVPYHAVDIFVRGDVSEFWAYAFIPLTFLGLYKVYEKRGSFKWVVVGSLGYAGVILSHNLTAMMITPFLVSLTLFYCFIILKEKKNLSTIYYLFFTLLLGLALSVFYFIPALSEQKYTNIVSQIGGGANFKDHFVCLSQLWQSPWGFGGSVPGCVDGLSFMIGKIHAVASIIAILAAIFLYISRKQKPQIVITFLSALGLLVSAFLTLEISSPVWEHISLMAYLQYPWRFLIFTSFFSSLLAGGVVFFSKAIFKTKWVEYLIFLFIIGAAGFLNIKFFQMQTYLNKNSNDYTNEYALKWTTSKISDEYMPRNFPKPINPKDVVNDKVSFSSRDIKVFSIFENTQKISLSLQSVRETKLHFNIAYFPFWELTVDGRAKGSIVSKGFDVWLSKGHHVVILKYVQTDVEKLSNFISLAGLFAILTGIILWKKKVIYA